MSRFKWRICFSIASVIFALALAHIAHGEYDAARQLHPGVRFSGKYGEMVPAAALSYCLNAPALFLSDLANNFLTRGLGWERLYSRFGPVDYYVSVFAFWWMVGWKFDRTPMGTSPGKVRLILGCSIGILLSILFLMLAVSGQYGRTVQIASAVWGLGLLFYFGKCLRYRS
jgi:hypothetical protein